jgi:hypothetical protein
VWNSEPAGVSIFFDTQQVSYDSRTLIPPTSPPTLFDYTFGPTFQGTSTPTSTPTLDGTVDPFYEITSVSQDACLDGYVMATILDSLGNPVVGIDVGFLLVGVNSYEGIVGPTDANGQVTFLFTADLVEAGSDLWCSIAVENPALPFYQNAPCSVSVCASAATSAPTTVGQTQPPTAKPTSGTTAPTPQGDSLSFDITFVSEDACPNGSVQATVLYFGSPVVGVDVGILMVGLGDNSYGGGGVTDANGQFTVFFTADPVDAGTELWCSIAVDNPYLPFDQNAPCSVGVCNDLQ